MYRRLLFSYMALLMVGGGSVWAQGSGDFNPLHRGEAVLEDTQLDSISSIQYTQNTGIGAIFAPRPRFYIGEESLPDYFVDTGTGWIDGPAGAEYVYRMVDFSEYSDAEATNLWQMLIGKSGDPFAAKKVYVPVPAATATSLQLQNNQDVYQLLLSSYDTLTGMDSVISSATTPSQETNRLQSFNRFRDRSFRELWEDYTGETLLSFITTGRVFTGQTNPFDIDFYGFAGQPGVPQFVAAYGDTPGMSGATEKVVPFFTLEEETDARLPQGADSQLAAGLKEGSKLARGQYQGVSQSRSVRELAIAWIRWAMNIIGVLCVVGIIYAGFLYMGNLGDESKVEQAQGIIRYVVVGIMVVFGAYGMVAVITRGGYLEQPIDTGNDLLDDILQDPLSPLTPEANVGDNSLQTSAGSLPQTSDMTLAINAEFCSRCACEQSTTPPRPILGNGVVLPPRGYVSVYCNPLTWEEMLNLTPSDANTFGSMLHQLVPDGTPLGSGIITPGNSGTMIPIPMVWPPNYFVQNLGWVRNRCELYENPTQAGPKDIAKFISDYISDHEGVCQ